MNAIVKPRGFVPTHTTFDVKSCCCRIVLELWEHRTVKVLRRRFRLQLDWTWCKKINQAGTVGHAEDKQSESSTVPASCLSVRQLLKWILTVSPEWTYCACSTPSCSFAHWCNPCWSGVLQSAVDWGHRPHERRWRIQAGETGRKGQTRRRWRHSLTWPNASCRGSGSCRPVLAGPPCSDWSRQARQGAAGCPPCLLRRQTKQWRVSWCNKVCWLKVALLKKNITKKKKPREERRKRDVKSLAKTSDKTRKVTTKIKMAACT